MTKISQIQAHPRIGYNIINRLPIFEEILLIVLYHQEQFDGLEYLDGIKGDGTSIQNQGSFLLGIPLDALSNDRPYRKAKKL